MTKNGAQIKNGIRGGINFVKAGLTLATSKHCGRVLQLMRVQLPPPAFWTHSQATTTYVCGKGEYHLSCRRT